MVACEMRQTAERDAIDAPDVAGVVSPEADPVVGCVSVLRDLDSPMFITGGSQDGFEPNLAALRQGLRDTGFVEGRNVKIEPLFADDQYERLPTLAADLIGVASPSSQQIHAALVPRRR